MAEKIFKYFVFITVLGCMIAFVVSRFSYLDPVSFCYISVEKDILRGNRQTVFKAIKTIKASDKKAYKELCEYAGLIREGYCSTSSRDYDTINIPGCYLRGSKTVYLKPVAEDSVAVTAERAEALKKFAGYSKDFWEGLKK